MRIYITHCSAKKNDSLKESKIKVTPDALYTATPTVRFIQKCIQLGVKWAIFSDKYGIWFPHEKHEWYEKSPDKVTEVEFRQLLDNFDSRLKGYDEIWFYHNSGRFHKFYKRLLKKSTIKGRIKLFSNLIEIT